MTETFKKCEKIFKISLPIEIEDPNLAQIPRPWS